jgi:transposase
MDKKRLKRLRRLLDSLRTKPANIRRRELVSLAKKLGRRRFDRGKEPTYVSDPFPDARPVTIPSHPGALKRFTASNILDQLEGDLSRWEEALDAEKPATENP